MKRYLLFAGSSYYPAGGWKDFRGSHDAVIDAIRDAATLFCDWWQVVDTQTGEIIEQGEKQ